MTAYGAVASARARLAVLTRYGAPPDELLSAKQDLEVAKTAQAISNLVTQWTLSDAQRGRLAACFSPH